MKERENFSSRLSFIIVSVSCAVGLGNIWLMPYRAGTYGGGLYVLLVVLFIIIFAIPILSAEYALGRASQQSVAGLFQKLQPPGKKWHLASYFMIAGNYLLLMFYVLICGFALMYLYKGITGELIGQNPEQIQAAFGNLTGNAGLSVLLTVIILAFGMFACYIGLKGVERVSKYMMAVFFAVILVLIVRSLTLPGAMEGLRFIFVPDPAGFAEHGVFRIIHMAMGQAVFSVSVGMGSMVVFGSYINRERRLLKDAFTVGVIDICVALLCLLMIFPAAFAFGISPTVGEGLLFVVMPNVFNQMPGTYLWALTFYAGLTFVSISTAIAVMENVVALGMDKFGWERKKSVIINFVALIILCLPAALGRNVWSAFTVPTFPHIGSFFTFLVMELIMPLGAIVFMLFAMSKRGWGWDNFLAELNTGETGWKVPTTAHFYLAYVLPAVLIFIFVFGLLQRFVF